MKTIKLLFVFAILMAFNTAIYAQCGQDTVEVKIRVHTDNYGDETTWTLKHASGAPTFASGGPYQAVSGGQLYIQNVCVPEGTPLVFRINDSYGDGICCAYGTGYYEVELYGYLFASGGEFGSYEETFFTASPPPAIDMGIVETNLMEYYGLGNITIAGTIKSFGTDTITNYTLNYSVNGGAPESHNFTALNILPFTTVSFTHPTPFNATASGTYNLKIWASDINGSIDENNDNDTIEVEMVVVSQIPQKYVLIEQATGTWCGFCPDGSVRLEQILQSNPYAIPAAIHNNDAMAFTAGNTVNSAYASGYPSGSIDRYKFSDVSGVGMGRGLWNAKANERMQHVVPATVEVTNTYNETTRVVNIEVTATFYADLNEEIRFNCYIVEDKMTGTGSGWSQANNYNNTPGHPMQGMGNPIVGYVHRHVLRAMLGGAFGTASSLPANITDGQTYTKTYTYTLPAGMKENDVRIIGMVKKYNTDTHKRSILNAKQTTLEGFTNLPDLAFVEELNIYPNPFNYQTNLVFSISENKNTRIALYNILGQEVYSAELGQLNTGFHHHTINADNLAKGIYNCVITFDNVNVTRKLIVQ